MGLWIYLGGAAVTFVICLATIVLTFNEREEDYVFAAWLLLGVTVAWPLALFFMLLTGLIEGLGLGMEWLSRRIHRAMKPTPNPGGKEHG